MLAVSPFDWQLHDSYFVVAHFHFTLVGGLVYGLFAGMYYWYPKAFGKMLSERLGKWHFWLFTIGFNMTFITLHFAGLLGMPRRIYTYQDGPGLGIIESDRLDWSDFSSCRDRLFRLEYDPVRDLG